MEITPALISIDIIYFWIILFSFCWLLPSILLTFFSVEVLDPGRINILLAFEVVVGFVSAALLTNENLDIVEDKALGHYTHEKSSVGCAAALATIDCLIEDGLLNNAVTLGNSGLEQLEALKLKYPIIHEVRGLGLFYGIDLKLNNQPASDQADAILYHSLSNGLSYKVGGGSILTLCPPLTINNDELTQAFSIIENGINSLN